jgi:ketosteroid isomerase-like protein
MPRDAVDVIREVNAAFNSGDMDRILAMLDPSFETSVPPEFSAEPDVYRGHGGIRRYFESFRDVMDEIRFEQLDLRTVGQYVVVDVRLTARGRATGISVQQRLAQVWTVRDGRAMQVRNFTSFADALAAADAGFGPGD